MWLRALLTPNPTLKGEQAPPEGEPPPSWHKDEQPHPGGHSPLSLVQNNEKLRYSPSSAAFHGLRRNEERAEPPTAHSCCPVQGFPMEGTGKAQHRQQRWSCLGWAPWGALWGGWVGALPCHTPGFSSAKPSWVTNPFQTKLRGFSGPG